MPRPSSSSARPSRSSRSSRPSRWLRDLNDAQRVAVETIEGPLLVLAGAGSGKTRVVTHRIAHMMDGGIAPSQILGLTFTNKAAEEMRERLVKMVGQVATDVTLSTFHSLGLAMLKAEAKRGRRAARFTIFDTADQLACLRDATRRLKLDRSFDLGSILERISSFKNEFLDPEQALRKLAQSEDPYDEAALELYPRYLEMMEAYAAVDFDDLVCRPAAMLASSGSCRERWADRYRYVLVDEYQDTNPAQLKLLLQLAGGHRNLCAVGDDDQSIYGWRGAELKNILRFEEHLPGAKIVKLEHNYRSVGRVLELANAVISQNTDRRPKTLRATREQGPRVKLVVAHDGEAEASWVARTIRRMVAEGRYRACDIAILYRSNIHARDLEPCLRAEGVDYRMLGGQAMFDRKEVKDVAAYLRLCVQPRDEIALRRAINSPPRGVGPATVAKLARWAEDKGRGLYAAIDEAEAVLGPSDRALKPLVAFRALIKRHGAELRRGGEMAVTAERMVAETGLRQEIERSSTSDKMVARRWGSVQALVRGLAGYQQRAAKPKLIEFLNRIALASADEDLSEGPRERVTMSTLHGSKGLEYPLVFLVGVEEGLLPHDRTLNPQANDHVTTEIAEERRLFYVGITRARSELVLTRADQRLVRGRPQQRPPSRFLEGVEQLLEVQDMTTAPPAEEVAEVKSMLADLRAKLGG